MRRTSGGEEATGALDATGGTALGKAASGGILWAISAMATLGVTLLPMPEMTLQQSVDLASALVKPSLCLQHACSVKTSGGGV